MHYLDITVAALINFRFVNQSLLNLVQISYTVHFLISFFVITPKLEAINVITIWFAHQEPLSKRYALFLKAEAIKLLSQE